MTQKTVPLSSDLGIVGVVDPDVLTTGAHTTAWISAAHFQSFMAVVMAGTLGAGATLDAKVEQATDGTGTDAKDVAGAAIVQLTQAGGDSDKQAAMTFSADDLDLENGFGHFRLSLTVASANCDGAAIVVASGGRYGPAGDYDAASVVEPVAV